MLGYTKSECLASTPLPQMLTSTAKRMESRLCSLLASTLISVLVVRWWMLQLKDMTVFYCQMDVPRPVLKLLSNAGNIIAHVHMAFSWVVPTFPKALTDLSTPQNELQFINPVREESNSSGCRYHQVEPLLHFGFKNEPSLHLSQHKIYTRKYNVRPERIQ